jgi:hypothetical protein
LDCQVIRCEGRSATLNATFLPPLKNLQPIKLN